MLTADEDRRDVARVLGGDREAFAALVERHQGRVRAHLRRLAPEAADDLAQEAFVRAYTSLAAFDAAFPFRGWLLVIATRLALNHRARRHERPAGEAIDATSAPDADPSRALAEADDEAALLKRIDAALATLPAEARALYELRFRQQLPLDELAAHFAVGVGAMKVRIHRLRSSLAERLGIDLDRE